MKRMKKVCSIAIVLIMTVTLFPTRALAEENLLVNGNAENGMEGWIDPDNLWYPSNDITPFEGEMFFWPSKGGCEYSYIYQDVDVSSYPVGTWTELSGYLANWDQYPHDEAALGLEFLNAEGKVIDSAITSQRNPLWKKHSIQLAIPKNAVIARIKLHASRYVGSDNDAYFDNLSFRVLDGSYKAVYISGKTATAKAGDKIQLTANNGVTTDASKYNWYSSYDSIATVNANGLVTFTSDWNGTDNEVTITAEDKETGITGTYYFNSEIKTKTPAPGKTTGLKMSSVTATTISMKWTKVSGASGYYVYKYNASTKKWAKVKTVNGSTSAKISNLKVNSSYKFKVIAYKNYGGVVYAGPGSSVVTIKTAAK